MRHAAAIAVLWASAAHAVEVAHDEGGATLEAGGFYKNLLFGLYSPLSGGGAIDAQIARLQMKWTCSDKLQIDVAWQATYLLASDPAFVNGTSLSSTIGGTGSAPQRRLWALGSTLVTTANSRLDQEIDRLALKVALPFGDLTVGRQVLSWGTGRFFNPTDVLSPFPPTAIDREVRRGFDAVRLAVAINEVTQLDLLYLPQQVPEENGGVARFQTNLKGWDVSVSAGKYVRDFVFGADVVGDIGPVNVHAEAAYTLEWLKGGGIGDHFARAVVGADYRPHEKVMLTVEYAFNGYGSTDPSKYAQILTSPRALRGEVFGAGMHVAALAANLRANDLLSAQASVLCNVTDPSALVFGSVDYSFTQQVLVRAGAYLPFGQRPDLALAATPSRGLRSEYGSAPYGAFIQVGLYVP